MKRFAQCGLLLQEHLQQVAARWPNLLGILLVDSAGLAMASTVESLPLEERLAALAGSGIGYTLRAQQDLEIGSVQGLHLGGQDRQILLIPVLVDVYLVAIATADASPVDLERLLLATARDLLALPSLQKV